MWAFLTSIWTFASSFPLPTIAAIGATVISITALVFVISRTAGPTSELLAEPQLEDDNDKQTDGVVRLLIRKDFVKELVKGYLDQQAAKPRFTFKEFVLFGMPAVISLALLGITGYLIYLKPQMVLDPNAKLPDFVTQAFTAVIAYYFGTAASKT